MDKTCRAGHLERGKGTRGMVVELTPVVTLDSLDGEAELRGHPGKEVKEGGKCLRLGTQGESPRVVREIIDHDQIVLAARNKKLEKSTDHSEQDQRHASHAKRRKKKEVEHDDPTGTHGRDAHQTTECKEDGHCD
jgi:hypothetical protein